MNDPGRRILIRSFCPQCDQHIESIGRRGDGSTQFFPCGHEVTADARIEVTDVDPEVEREEAG